MPAGGSLPKAPRCNLSDEDLIKREDKGTFSGRYVSGALATAEPMVVYLLHLAGAGLSYDSAATQRLLHAGS